MTEIFKTVLMLSALGSGLILLIWLIKPFTMKHFPAAWHSVIWLCIALLMLLPVWKLIPRQQAQNLTPYIERQQSREQANMEDIFVPDTTIPDAPALAPEDSPNPPWLDIFAGIWLGGFLLWMVSTIASYVLFLYKKRKHSLSLSENTALEAVKNELHVKRKIRLRIDRSTDSPMLVGCLFPVIYLPDKELEPEKEKMIFRHELTHYKHRDLCFKWLVALINALHWFNPFAYLLSAGVSQSCEVACDMAVIQGLNPEEQKLYMNTILDLVEKKERS